MHHCSQTDIEQKQILKLIIWSGLHLALHHDHWFCSWCTVQIWVRAFFNTFTNQVNDFPWEQFSPFQMSEVAIISLLLQQQHDEEAWWWRGIHSAIQQGCFCDARGGTICSSCVENGQHLKHSNPLALKLAHDCSKFVEVLVCSLSWVLPCHTWRNTFQGKRLDNGTLLSFMNQI